MTRFNQLVNLFLQKRTNPLRMLQEKLTSVKKCKPSCLLHISIKQILSHITKNKFILILIICIKLQVCHFAYKYTLNIHFLVAFPIIVYANHHKISTNDIKQSSLVKHKTWVNILCLPIQI